MMLMDEPFSALDALTRGTLQDEVRRICLETGQTAFMITHDVDEAIYLADRIVLMTNGPQAMIAEIVENPLPRDRIRSPTIAHAPRLLRHPQPSDRLPGRRARSFKPTIPDGYDRATRRPVVRPGPSPAAVATAPHRRPSRLTHDQGEPMKRESSPRRSLDIKREKDWSWKYITERDRRHVRGADRRRAARPDEAGQAAGRKAASSSA